MIHIWHIIRYLDLSVLNKDILVNIVITFSKKIQHATTNTCGILNFPFYMGLVPARSQQHHILINAHKLFKATTSCTLAYDSVYLEGAETCRLVT